jgi:RNA polymerase sigma-70 factor (ECF subfamily)
MCGDTQIAEDAAQEAFIQAWLHLAAYRPQTPLRNWLYRIAVNAATDMLRKEKRILPNALEDLQLSDPQPGPEALYSQAERTVLVQKAIVSLPEACRAVLVLKEYEGMSYQRLQMLWIFHWYGDVTLELCRKVLKDKLEQKLFLPVRLNMSKHITEWLNAYLDGELHGSQLQQPASC